MLTKFTNKKILLLGFFILLFCSFGFSSKAEAATYYIDYSSGSDSNSGTSSLTPWQHPPGDSRATGSANITLSPGDVVVFKGGVTYSFDNPATDSLSANASGSNGNIIIYKSGDTFTPTWGTGRAVIDGTNSFHSYNTGTHINAVFNLKNFSYLKVDGLEVKNLSASASAEALIGWLNSSGSGGNITINNVYLHDATTTGNTGGSGIIIQGDSSNAGNASNFTISNSLIQTMGQHGIWVRSGVDNVTIISNNILDVGLGTVGGDPLFLGGLVPLTYTAPTNYEISGNDLGNSINKSNIFLGLMSSTTIEKNYLHGITKTSGIDINGAVNDLTIRNNIIYTSPTSFGGLLRFYPAQDTSLIRDNIKVYNNTIIGASINTTNYGSIMFARGSCTLTPCFTNVDVRNNIIDTLSNSGVQAFTIWTGADTVNPVVQLSTLTVDYNSYNYGTNSTPFYSWTNSVRSFTNWKSDIGGDTHSTVGAVSFVNKAGADFQLVSSDTQAKDLGTTLTSFSDDYNSVSRPQGVAWDIGAYEYVPPTPTYTITASSGANGSITPSGSVSVNNGSNQAFTITPNSGYHIDTITADGVAVSATSPYTFTNVTADHTISATFAADVVVSHGGGGGSSNYVAPTITPTNIPNCGTRTTGFSATTGQSCTNTSTTKRIYNFGITTLRLGSQGEAVKELQRFLNDKLNLGLVFDGKLGPKTIAIVKIWQKDHNLVADGLVGAKTKAIMNGLPLPVTSSPVITSEPIIKPSIKPATNPSTYNFGTTTLRIGSQGEAVKELQRFLNKAFNLNMDVNGQFGDNVVFGVMRWQLAHSLVVDGVLDEKTKKSMGGI